MNPSYQLSIIDIDNTHGNSHVIVSVERSIVKGKQMKHVDTIEIPLDFDYMGIFDFEAEYDKELWRDIMHAHQELCAQNIGLPSAIQMRPLIERNFYGIGKKIKTR